MSTTRARSNRRTSLLGRGVEWFWLGTAIAESAGARSAANSRVKELVCRARVSSQIGLLALTPSESLDAPGEAVATELFRQSVYWSACALAARSELPLVGDQHYDLAVWNTVDHALLAEATKSKESAESLRENLASGSFVNPAQLSASQLLGARMELQRLAEALLVRVEGTVRDPERLRRQRAWRLGTLVVTLLLLVLAGTELRRFRELRSDLLVARPWQTSSSNGGGCTSPAQECREAQGFFFHTQVDDESPWISFDLGSVREVSGVEIDNRKDCCAERTLHLVVEVSEDGRKWTSVARHEEMFTIWHTSFATVRARWLRIRIDARGTLHLSRVRAYP